MLVFKLRPTKSDLTCFHEQQVSTLPQIIESLLSKQTQESYVMNFKFEGSPVANKFRAAAKKAIAANRVRDSPKVSQPSGKQRTISTSKTFKCDSS